MPSKEFVDELTPRDVFPLFESIRKSLSYYFATHVIQHPTLRSAYLSCSCGVFITYRDQKGNVRGCMGLLDTDRPLMYAAIDSAIAAAVDDPRYERIIIDDVVGISIEMTLIKGITEISGNFDDARAQFVPGMHGLYAESGVKAGVLLPRDIADLGLDFDGALRKVRAKAGITSASADAKYYMFPARVFVQTGLGTDVMDITKAPAQKQPQDKRAKKQKPQPSKKGFLSFLAGDSK
ncbi:MAG: AMMECR1 family protein [Candidatus Micrarchaeota archaeon]|nr:AMMECR1 family protein [Candidatus Micrarchaeota archaeon]